MSPALAGRFFTREALPLLFNCASHASPLTFLRVVLKASFIECQFSVRLKRLYTVTISNLHTAVKGRHDRCCYYFYSRFTNEGGKAQRGAELWLSRAATLYRVELPVGCHNVVERSLGLQSKRLPVRPN